MKRGAVLFETVLFLELLVVLGASAHLWVLRGWNGKLKGLQRERRVYDGVRAWKS